MIPTPGRLAKHYAIGAVNYHTGEMIVIFRKHKKRIQMAEFLRIVLAQFSDKQVILVWDTVHTHKGGIEQEYPQRLKLMYLPTYSPWLNPIEML